MGQRKIQADQLDPSIVTGSPIVGGGGGSGSPATLSSPLTIFGAGSPRPTVVISLSGNDAKLTASDGDLILESLAGGSPIQNGTELVSAVGPLVLSAGSPVEQLVRTTSAALGGIEVLRGSPAGVYERVLTTRDAGGGSPVPAHSHSLASLSDVDMDFFSSQESGGSPRPQTGDFLIYTDVEGGQSWASRTVGLDPAVGYGAGSLAFRRGSPTTAPATFSNTAGMTFQEGSPRGLTIFGKINFGGANGPYITGTGANFSTPTQPILAISRKNKLTGIGGVASGSPRAGTVSIIVNGTEVTRAITNGSPGVQFIVAPSVQNNEARPSLAFGDGDSGFYESIDDAIGVSLAGARAWIFQAGSFTADTGNGPRLMNEAATATNPTLIPHLGASNTGIGANAALTVSVIANAIECMRFDEASGVVTNQNFGQMLSAIGINDNLPAYAFINDENTGLTSIAADTLALVTGATTRLDLTNTTASFFGSPAVVVIFGGSPTTDGMRIRNLTTGSGLERVLTVSDLVNPGSPNTLSSPLTVQGVGSPLPTAVLSVVGNDAKLSAPLGDIIVEGVAGSPTQTEIVSAAGPLVLSAGTPSVEVAHFSLTGSPQQPVLEIINTEVSTQGSPQFAVRRLRLRHVNADTARISNDGGGGQLQLAAGSPAAVLALGGSNAFWSGLVLGGLNAAAGAILNETVSETNPTIVPNRSFQQDGLGWRGSPQLLRGPTIVTLGTEVARFMVVGSPRQPVFEIPNTQTSAIGSPEFVARRFRISHIDDDTARIKLTGTGGVLEIGAGSPARFITIQGGGFLTWGGSGLSGNSATSAAILNETATRSNPTLVPNKSNRSTGIGGGSPQNSLSIIVGRDAQNNATEVARFGKNFDAGSPGQPFFLIPNALITTGSPEVADSNRDFLIRHVDGDTAKISVTGPFGVLQLASGSPQDVLTVGGPNAHLTWSGGRIAGTNAQTGAIFNEAATVSNPTIIPRVSGPSTGIGSGSSFDLTVVIRALEAQRWTESGGSPFGVQISNQANVNITADVSSIQGGAPITSSFNVYSTVATIGDAATLPATFEVGTRVYIKNDAANSMDVFPALGDDAGAGTNTAVAVAGGAGALFLATVASTTWTQMF